MIAALIHIAEPPRLTVPVAIFADVGVTAPPPRLDWPEGTIVRAEEADGELIVRFDRPLASASIDAFRGFVMLLMLAEAMRLWTVHTAFP